MASLAVLGAGSWGTALALQLSRGGHDVVLWAHREKHLNALQQDCENQQYLAGFPFPANLVVEGNLTTIIDHAEAILTVVPSHAFSPLLHHLRTHLKVEKPILWAIKGFADTNGTLLSQSFTRNFPPDYPHAILAGPSFAREVAAGQPTAVTIAGNTLKTAEYFAYLFHGSNFLCYTTTDLIGVQVGGAVKNVIAIATGIADGLGCGANARAALITRGLREMNRLSAALGGEPETLAGLAGMGDLVLTCTDNQSRNRRFGLALGAGESPELAKKTIAQVVEGEGAAHDTFTLAKRLNVRMPITTELHYMLSGSKTLQETVAALLSRQIKLEAQ